MSMSVILVPLSETQFEVLQKDPFDAFSFVHDEAAGELTTGSLRIPSVFVQLSDVLDSTDAKQQAGFMAGDMVGGDDPMAAIEAFEGCPPNLHDTKKVQALSELISSVDHAEFAKRYEKWLEAGTEEGRRVAEQSELVEHLQPLKEFFSTAAKQKHRVLVWMDF